MATTPSMAQAQGISVHVYDPLVWTQDRRGWFEQVNDVAEGWEQESTAEHGFDNATLSLKSGQGAIEHWLAQGLGRDVRAFNPSGCVTWEGFVNQIDASVGGKQVSVGPLVEVGNRVLVSYALLDTTTFPPTSGGQVFTTLVDDADSQYKYGIWEKVVDGGSLTPADADRLRDTALRELREPQTSKAVSPTGDLSLRINCLGYWAWLQAYVYQYTAGVAAVTLEAKLQDVLEADPNGVFYAMYSYIDANGWLTSEYEGDNRAALSVIEDIARLGDANDTRWTFGVYEGRAARYGAIPDTIAYQNRVALGDAIETFAPPGGIVRPWDVRPARWLFFSDFMSGTAIPCSRDELYADPRALFVESVRYSAPYGLQINGERVGTLRQAVAKATGGH